MVPNEELIDDFSAVRAKQDATPWQSLWAQADLAYAIAVERGRRTATLLFEATGLSKPYIRQIINVAETFPPAKRDPRLTFSHFRVAAPTAEPYRWIERAAEGGWSVKRLSQEIEAERARDAERGR